MPLLSVYFKDKMLESVTLVDGLTRIGRDLSNDVVIDSLAIAPVHAVITLKGDIAKIRQLQEDYPVILNNEKTKESVLNSNDTIALGKHTLRYIASQPSTPAVFSEQSDTNHVNSAQSSTLKEPLQLPNGNFQIMDGENIGKIVPIKKNMIQLGRPGHGIAVITRKKEGYFVSALEVKDSLTINGEPLGNKILKLHNNDIISISDKSLQFFLS